MCLLCIHYTLQLKRVWSPNFNSAIFIWVRKSFKFMSLLHLAGIGSVVRKGGWEKIILAALLPHVEAQLSAQPVLTSNDEGFEWSSQPLRDHRMR